MIFKKVWYKVAKNAACTLIEIYFRKEECLFCIKNKVFYSLKFEIKIVWYIKLVCQLPYQIIKFM